MLIKGNIIILHAARTELLTSCYKLTGVDIIAAGFARL